MKIPGKKTVIASALLAAVSSTDLKSILWDVGINLGVEKAIAWQQLEKNEWEVIHINSPTEIAEKWSPKDIFYVQWNIPISDSVLNALTQKINKEYPDTQYTFFFTGENPSDFSYKNRDWNNFRWKDAIEFALSESLLWKTNLGIWKKHVVIWISFERDNNWERWVRPLTSVEFDDLWIGENSRFSHESWPLFSKVFPQLKSWNFPWAIEIIAEGYDTKYNQIISQKQAEKERKQELFKQNLENAKKWIKEVEQLHESLTKEYEDFLWNKPIVGWDEGILEHKQNAKKYLSNENPWLALKHIDIAKKIIWSYQTLIKGYDSYRKNIFLAWEALNLFKENEYIDKFMLEYKIANDLYKKALSEWENKDFNYVKTIGLLNESIDALYEEFKDAEEAQLYKDVATKWWSSLALLLSGIVWFLANKKRKLTKQEFEKELSRWQKTLDKAYDELLDEIDDKEEILSLLFEDSSWETKTRVDQLSQDVWALSVMLPKLSDTLKQIEREVWSDIWVNLFSSKWYSKWLSLLEDEEIQINPTTDRLDKHLLRVIWKQKISTLSELAQSMTYTFEWMIKETDSRISSIRSIFIEFDEANSNFDEEVNNSFELKTKLKSSLELLSRNIWEKSAESFPYITEFLNSFTDNLDKLSKTALLDKLGSYNVILEINKKLKIFTDGIKSINNFVIKNNPYKDKTELDFDWYDTNWFIESISKSYKSLWEETKSIFSDKNLHSFEENIKRKLDKIIESYNELKNLNTTSNKKEQLEETIEWITLKVEEIKENLSKDYDIDKKLLFKEDDHNPYKRFEKINSLQVEVKELLDNWKEEEANKKLIEIEKLLSEIEMIIKMTKWWFDVYDTRKNEIQSISSSINSNKDKAKELLDKIKEKWSPEVLKLWEWDITHPDSDGDLWNNIIEIEENYRELKNVIEWANQFRENWASISAIWELDRARAINEDSSYRLMEINQKYKRLEDTDIENTNLLSDVNNQLELIANIQDKNYITWESRDKFINILSFKTELENRALEEKRNPFKINEGLIYLLLKINELDNNIKRDKQAYEYFLKRINTIDNLITQLESESEEARYDNYPDSEEAINVFEQLTPKYREFYNVLLSKQDLKHEDWHILLSNSEYLIEDINKAISILREDTDERLEAERYINKARHKIWDARRWSWSYWISIYGHYWVNDLSRAEEAYSRWDFDEVDNYASIAYRNAIRAIEEAEEEVRREIRRREEEARRRREEEAERARAAARRRASMSSSSSSSRSSSSSSGFWWWWSFSSSSSGFWWWGSW